MADNQNERKPVFLINLEVCHRDVLMRAGAATLGAKNLPEGLAAAGNQYADFF